MTLRQYIDLIRRRWVSLVVGLVLGGLAGLAVVGLSPRQYTAEVTMFISARGAADSVGSAYEGGLLAQGRIPSYTELVTSDRLMRETVERASLTMSPADLRRDVTVTTQPDSTILHIAVRDASGDEAARIANKIGERFIALVDDIEKPNDPARIPAVSAYLLEPAVPPSSPSSPRPWLDIAFGIFLGLVGGVVVAVVRNSLDTRISTPAQLAELTGTRTLGSIVTDARSSAHPLVMRDRPYSESAEGYRQLWTNLRFGDAASPHKAVVVTSPSTDDGKTTVACNLALAGVEAGARVLLVDANARAPKVDRFLHLDGNVVGLVDVLQDMVEPELAIQFWSDLHVLLSGRPPERFSNAVAGGMRALFDRLGPSYDQIIVDAPALLPFADASALAGQADGVLLVVRHGATSSRQAVDAINALDAVSARLLGSVLTLSPRRATASAAAGGPARRPAAGERPVTEERPDAAVPPATVPVPVPVRAARKLTVDSIRAGSNSSGHNAS